MLFDSYYCLLTFTLLDLVLLTYVNNNFYGQLKGGWYMITYSKLINPEGKEDVSILVGVQYSHVETPFIYESRHNEKTHWHII